MKTATWRTTTARTRRKRTTATTTPAPSTREPSNTATRPTTTVTATSTRPATTLPPSDRTLPPIHYGIALGGGAVFEYLNFHRRLQPFECKDERGAAQIGLQHIVLLP